jgi:hypothetical protein
MKPLQIDHFRWQIVVRDAPLKDENHRTGLELLVLVLLMRVWTPLDFAGWKRSSGDSNCRRVWMLTAVRSVQIAAQPELLRFRLFAK